MNNELFFFQIKEDFKNIFFLLKETKKLSLHRF